MAYATDLCGSKLRAKLNSTFNESSSQKISTKSFAAKQMEKMGWTEGTGLGKKRDGIASHIKVRKREENIGLGVEKERTRQMGVEGMWWSSSVSDTLMKLQKKSKNGKEQKKSKKRRKSSKNDKSDGENVEGKPKVYTDEELFIATGGARFGMRAQRRAEGKWQRTENSAELKKLELETKHKVEWNGLGKASVVLGDKKSGSMNLQNTRIIGSSIKRKRVDDEEKKEENVDKNAGEIESCASSHSGRKERKRRTKEKKHGKKSKSKKSKR